jgi:hypothetical protein
LTLEDKERMMRENDQTQQIKTHGEIIPERKMPSNTPLMSMTPISSTNNSSSSYYKDLTSNLFEQKPPQQSLYGMSNSQTMPSLMRPTIVHPIKPTPNFASSSHTTDLTASLMNNMNSLGSRPQTTPTMMSLNSMNGITGGNVGLFQQPPPASTVTKGTSKSAAAELDDLFN